MEKINIAELLKDCPKGTKLYSPLCGECYFNRLNMGTIICKKQNTQEITFTSEGYYMLPVFDDCECVLFPSKENRDWSKFQRPFKDGDIIYTHTDVLKCNLNSTFISIFKECNDGKYMVYVGYCIDSNSFYSCHTTNAYFCDVDEIIEQHLATDEERR